MQFVIGIDGGGSQTRAWLAEPNGRVIGRASTTGSNAFRLGNEAAARVLVEAACSAWRDAALPGTAPQDIAALFAGVAGAGAVEDQVALSKYLSQALGLPATRCQVDHDLRIAHVGALAGQPGAVLVVGTGAACYGRTTDRRSWKAGGWGPTLDDGGSGYWLGLHAMRAIVRAADGRGKATSMNDAVFTQLAVKTTREMLNQLRNPSASGIDTAAIARLAPLVLTAATCGDAIASGIVEAGAQELALMVEAVLSHLGLDIHRVGRVSCAGGLMENQDSYRERVAEAIARLVPTVHLEQPGLPPVAGAVLLALELIGRPIRSGVVTRLLETADAAHEPA